ncbi:MAG: shikimate dehydrogenase [Trueperaceae bacterium]
MREKEPVASRRVLLLAHPAGHSLSPAMHTAGFRALGIDASYEALDVPPEALPGAVRALRGSEFLGANVTVPHKRAVAGLVDDLDTEARAIGAVNTIVKDEGRLVGRNTDAPGFLAALRETGFAPAGHRCLVLGAGGAARAVTWALMRSGAEVLVANRSENRARDLAADLGTAGAVATAPRWLPNRDVAASLPGCDLLVNTTSVGMAGGPAPDGDPLPEGADVRALPTAAVVVDLVYRPGVTPLLARAEAAGLRRQNGVAMLVWQGALAFEAWTGRDAPVVAMRRAVEGALAQDERAAAEGDGRATARDER